MITLEFLSDAHQTELVQIANDPKISVTSGVPYPCDRNVVAGWVAANKTQPPKALTFAIVYGSQLAGCCSLKHIDWASREAELSFWLGPSFWGKGIGSVAANMTRDFGFDVHNLTALHAHYLKSTNPASGRILQKAGFVPDITRQDMAVEGRYQHLAPDVWTFCKLSREAWLSTREPRAWAITAVQEYNHGVKF